MLRTESVMASVVDDLRSHAKIEQFQADGSPQPASPPTPVPAPAEPAK